MKHGIKQHPREPPTKHMPAEARYVISPDSLTVRVWTMLWQCGQVVVADDGPRLEVGMRVMVMVVVVIGGGGAAGGWYMSCTF